MSMSALSREHIDSNVVGIAVSSTVWIFFATFLPSFLAVFWNNHFLGGEVQWMARSFVDLMLLTME